MGMAQTNQQHLSQILSSASERDDEGQAEVDSGQYPRLLGCLTALELNLESALTRMWMWVDWLISILAWGVYPLYVVYDMFFISLFVFMQVRAMVIS